MSLNSNLIFMWPGSVATIPAGWSRVTSLDGMFPLVDPTGTLSAGGGASHTHTAESHTHQVSSGNGNGFLNYDDQAAHGGIPASVLHSHGVSDSASAVVTLLAADNLPPYYEVIFIKSDGSQTGVPPGAWAFWDNASGLPAGWTAPSGPVGRFLKGAATGLAGGGTGGSVTHTHTEDSHSHGAADSSQAVQWDYHQGTTIDLFANSDHTHSLSLSGSTESVSSSDGQPAYENYQVIENISVAQSLPDGVIGFSLSSYDPTSTGWNSVSISGDMVRCDTAGNLGLTGGSTQHAHNTTAHSHSVTVGSTTNDQTGHPMDPNVQGQSASKNHTHTWTAGNGQSVIDLSTSRASYPPYQPVKLLKLVSHAALRSLQIGVTLGRLTAVAAGAAKLRSLQIGAALGRVTAAPQAIANLRSLQVGVQEGRVTVNQTNAPRVATLRSLQVGAQEGRVSVRSLAPAVCGLRSLKIGVQEARVSVRSSGPGIVNLRSLQVGVKEASIRASRQKVNIPADRKIPIQTENRLIPVPSESRQVPAEVEA